MNFFCEKCNYTTTRKADYTKHKNSNKHLKNSAKSFSCKNCNKVFNAKSSYYYHYNKCNNSENPKNTDNIGFIKIQHELELSKLKCEYQEEKVKMLEYMLSTTTKTTEKALDITEKTISAIKYANEHFKDAPTLEPLDDFSLLDRDPENEKDKQIILDVILYHYRMNSLHKLFGDHIISLYKKDKLEDRSMHTTDTSRMNYIVKISKDTKPAKWYTDKNGILVCDYIIEKLINYYVDLLKMYQTKLLTEMALDPGRPQKERQLKVENILALLGEVDNGQLVKDTNKYIVPHFNLNK
jgi:hypothetical protein